MLDRPPRERKSTLDTFNDEMAVLDRPLEGDVEFADEAPRPSRMRGVALFAGIVLGMGLAGGVILSRRHAAAPPSVQAAQPGTGTGHGGGTGRGAHAPAAGWRRRRPVLAAQVAPRPRPGAPAAAATAHGRLRDDAATGCGAHAGARVARRVDKVKAKTAHGKASRAASARARITEPRLAKHRLAPSLDVRASACVGMTWPVAAWPTTASSVKSGEAVGSVGGAGGFAADAARPPIRATLGAQSGARPPITRDRDSTIPAMRARAVAVSQARRRPTTLAQKATRQGGAVSPEKARGPGQRRQAALRRRWCRQDAGEAAGRAILRSWRSAREARRASGRRSWTAACRSGGRAARGCRRRSAPSTASRRGRAPG